MYRILLSILILPGITLGYNTSFATSNEIYNGCGSTKLCFGHPSECFKTKNCTSALAVSVSSNIFSFELLGPPNASYVAVGLSSDKKMGNDSVVECLQTNQYASVTYPKISPFVSRTNVPQSIIQPISHNYSNGRIYCSFRRNTTSNVSNVHYDLVNERYYLFLVSGNRVNSDSVGFHDILFITTESHHALSEKKILYEDPKIMYRLHGTFMLIAWILLANFGIMIARHFRRHWIGQKICDKDIWFSLHRIIMISAWTCTMIGFVLIMMEVGGWVNPSMNTHAILGMTTIALCFIQPIGALFRPAPDAPNRKYFNIIHKFGGTSAVILGLVTIFFAVSLSKLGLPGYMTYVLIGFVVFHVITHFALHLSDLIRDGKLEYGNIFEMYRSGQDPNVREPMAGDDTQKQLFQQIVLIVYTVGNLGFLIALICFVWMAPSS